MSAPIVSRPIFPPGYVDRPSGHVAWDWIEQQLSDAVHYWLCSVRPDGRPHAVPKWAVYVDGRIYFDGSGETRHARNLAQNPAVVLHLESGERAVIVEGSGRAIDRPPSELGLRLARAYGRKYADLGYSPEPAQWDEGGLFEVVPRVILAWTKFTEDPTKFVLAA
jgi:nitroimidazol reductase NimA-like FMN-containing flavoprotein (pyridoxamine 5'-phosphate oxidase superfamily)